MITQPETDKTTLRQFLNHALYADHQQFNQLQPADLLEYLFCNYYVFLTEPPTAYWAEFQDEAIRLLLMKGLGENEITLLLRSSRFIKYVQEIQNHFPDPPVPSTF